MDYRTAWQKADDKKAVETLVTIGATLPLDEAREAGIAVLLDRVHPDVADAYRRMRERIETA
jgi:hypothetical protein